MTAAADTFDAVAAEVKAADAADSAAAESVLYLTAPSALRMASCWKRLRREQLEPHGPPPTALEAKRAWMWAQVEYSVDEWAALAGVLVPEARGLDRVLRGNLIVYPDGSLNEVAANFIAAKAQGMLKGRRKRDR